MIKIDIEGSEVAALRGARRLLAQPERPALLFEFNPVTLAECGASVKEFEELLDRYSLYYVDDLEGQKLPYGQCLTRLADIDWQCKLFAVPRVEDAPERWSRAFSRALLQVKN